MPATVQKSNGCLETFMIDSKGAIEHIWELTPGGTYSQWKLFATGPFRQLSVKRGWEGRAGLFALGMDNILLMTDVDDTQQGQGVGWQQIGTGLREFAIAGLDYDNTHIFGIDFNFNIVHMYKIDEGNYSGWGTIGKAEHISVAQGDPPLYQVVSQPRIFVLDQQGDLYQIAADVSLQPNSVDLAICRP